jgi:BirA family biotin operon repressor/biotin-[acetyl-CoA-carboxylase] ligase
MPSPRIRAFSDGTYLLEFDELGSTQDEAKERARAGEERLVGVRANYQTRGRGRRGADWYAPRGECLLITYLMPVLTPDQYAAARLSMASGIALATAVNALTGLDVRLRWPNDVVLGSRKLAGTLVELAPAPLPHRPDRHIAAIGIGLNVNVTTWPESLAATAVSLQQASGRAWPIEMVEAAVRTALIDAQRLQDAPNADALRNAWMARDATIGARYLTYGQREPIIGTATGITGRGELVLRTDAGPEMIVLSARHVAERTGS